MPAARFEVDRVQSDTTLQKPVQQPRLNPFGAGENDVVGADDAGLLVRAPTGASAATTPAMWTVHSFGRSPGSPGESDRNPCETALSFATAFPVAVFGPIERFPVLLVRFELSECRGHCVALVWKFAECTAPVGGSPGVGRVPLLLVESDVTDFWLCTHLQDENAPTRATGIGSSHTRVRGVDKRENRAADVVGKGGPSVDDTAQFGVDRCNCTGNCTSGAGGSEGFTGIRGVIACRFVSCIAHSRRVNAAGTA